MKLSKNEKINIFCTLVGVIGGLFWMVSSRTPATPQTPTKSVTQQAHKKRIPYFKDFQEEKNFCINTAFNKIREIGEVPTAWYSDHADFVKNDQYTAYIGYIKLKNSSKLAYCHVQYRMVRDYDSQYISKPEVYMNTVTITNNFLN